MRVANHLSAQTNRLAFARTQTRARGGENWADPPPPLPPFCTHSYSRHGGGEKHGSPAQAGGGGSSGEVGRDGGGLGSGGVGGGTGDDGDATPARSSPLRWMRRNLMAGWGGKGAGPEGRWGFRNRASGGVGARRRISAGRAAQDDGQVIFGHTADALCLFLLTARRNAHTVLRLLPILQSMHTTNAGIECLVVVLKALGTRHSGALDAAIYRSSSKTRARIRRRVCDISVYACIGPMLDL